MWVFTIVIFLATGLMLVFGRKWADAYREKQRTKLSAIGRELGLYCFSDGGQQTILPLLRDLPSLGLGRSQTILYPLEGEVRGIVVALFELNTYSGSSGTQGYGGGVFLLMRSPQFQFPSFVLQRGGRALGRHPLRFDGRPQFSRHYRLTGSDEADLRRIFSASTLDFVERQTHSFILRGNDQRLLYTRFWTRLDRVATREKLGQFLEEGLAIAQALSGSGDRR